MRSTARATQNPTAAAMRTGISRRFGAFEEQRDMQAQVIVQRAVAAILVVDDDVAGNVRAAALRCIKLDHQIVCDAQELIDRNELLLARCVKDRIAVVVDPCPRDRTFGVRVNTDRFHQHDRVGGIARLLKDVPAGRRDGNGNRRIARRKRLIDEDGFAVAALNPDHHRASIECEGLAYRLVGGRTQRFGLSFKCGTFGIGQAIIVEACFDRF
ncbi:MAG: hypothetical protein IPM16_07910 [Chloroflexi bacterium]|nr:hypothetical protein [Chloroflexota bacterium]